MDTEGHRKVTEIFLSVCDLSLEERIAALERLCGRDAVLRGRVEAMLAFESKRPDFLAQSPAQSLASAPPSIPERLGSFRILSKLGEGSMGVVFEAEQEKPRRSVALKVLKMTFGSERVSRRFEYEAELLGRLHHPGIAQVYEAGIQETSNGPQPYFAMELVRGEPITQHARRLDLAGRLQLMATVCDAVEHAHRQGIIHRDLKPANILVGESGHPKILDFGVARAAGSTLEGRTLQTAAGQIVGTLSYMSPEQATADGELDTRSDVYSLGVLLYEILAGHLPYDVSSKGTLEALRVIRDAEPQPLDPSRKELRGDVAIIVSKALQKDREHRYGSASALAADLRRFLDHQPIEAQPPSPIYRLRKLVRRHRGLSAGLALTAAAIVFGLIGTSWQAYEKTRAEGNARREATSAVQAKERAEIAEGEATLRRREAEQARDQARDAAATALAINRFLLLDVLQSPDPRVRGRDIKVLDVLQQASEHVAAEFAGQPRIAAAIHATLARSYLAVDELDRAEAQGQQALELCRTLGPDEDPDAMNAMATLVEIHTARNDGERGIPLARETLQLQRLALGAESPDTLTTMTNLATLLMNHGEVVEAEALLRETIAARERVLGPEHTATLLAGANLASLLSRLGRLEESERLQQRVYEVRARVSGKEHPDTLLARLALDFTRFARGELPDAEHEFRDLVETMVRVYGEHHHQASTPMIALAHALQAQRKTDEALSWFQRAYEMRLASLGEEHPMTAEARQYLASCLGVAGRIDDAVALADEDLEIQRRVSPAGDSRLADSMTVLGELLGRAGQEDEAQALLREAQSIYERAYASPSDPHRVRVRNEQLNLEHKRRTKRRPSRRDRDRAADHLDHDADRGCGRGGCTPIRVRQRES